jgi:hypothetical protein
MKKAEIKTELLKDDKETSYYLYTVYGYMFDEYQMILVTRDLGQALQAFINRSR